MLCCEICGVLLWIVGDPRSSRSKKANAWYIRWPQHARIVSPKLCCDYDICAASVTVSLDLDGTLAGLGIVLSKALLQCLYDLAFVIRIRESSCCKGSVEGLQFLRSQG